MPALPYSKKRYYLSGIDWIIGLLNSYMCSTTVSGNHSSLILHLERAVTEEDLKSRIDLIYNELPILSGCLSRDLLNLAPYWKVPRASLKNYDLKVLKIDSDDTLDESLTSILNSPFSSGNTYLSFTLLKSKTEHFLLMTFDLSKVLLKTAIPTPPNQVNQRGIIAVLGLVISSTLIL
jgi:hypothetical protein